MTFSTLFDIEELKWQEEAACRGPHARVFFPPMSVERRDVRELREARAKAICHDCPVMTDCREHAIAHREQHGVWGGLNEQERRALWEGGYSPGATVRS